MTKNIELCTVTPSYFPPSLSLDKKSLDLVILRNDRKSLKSLHDQKYRAVYSYTIILPSLSLNKKINH